MEELTWNLISRFESRYWIFPRHLQSLATSRQDPCVNTPPAKAGGFGLRLKAGLIGHAADLHLSPDLLGRVNTNDGISD